MVMFRMEVEEQYSNDEKCASDLLSSSSDKMNEEEKISNNSVNMSIIYQLLHLLYILLSAY